LKGHGFSRADPEAQNVLALAAEGCFLGDFESPLRGYSPGFFRRICGTRPRGRPGHALSKPIFPCLQSSCDSPRAGNAGGGLPP
jgi:hypothetical protein